MSHAEEWTQTELPLEEQEASDNGPSEHSFCWPDVAPTLTASSRGAVVLQQATSISIKTRPDGSDEAKVRSSATVAKEPPDEHAIPTLPTGDH